MFTAEFYPTDQYDKVAMRRCAVEKRKKKGQLRKSGIKGFALVIDQKSSMSSSSSSSTLSGLPRCLSNSPLQL